MMEDLLDRDAALLDRVLEAYALGELDERQLRDVEAHLAHHADDRARLAALRAHQAGFVARALGAAGAVRGSRRWGFALGGLAVAAGLLWAVLSIPPDSGWRVKGSGHAFALEAWLERPDGDVALTSGAVVMSGARVGFRARGAEGYLLVVGIDRTHAPYPAVDTEGQAVRFEASIEPRDLEAAVRFDETPGQERLVGLLCGAPVGLSDIREALVVASRTTPPVHDLPPLRPDCLQAEIRLTKGLP